MRKIIVGVIGPGREANVESIRNAIQLGFLIATEGWILLTGGKNCGVMNAVNEGAKQANGLTVGILPNNDHSTMSTSVDIAILTGMGQARNNINALSSDLLIACGLGPGTASEIALAIKANKKVILLGLDAAAASFFQKLGPRYILVATTAAEAIDLAKNIINASDNVQPR
jgi:uncharacterized protein (TIGR00725 family)